MATSRKITRFSRGERCPVCGGCDDDPRGQGRRCFGFASGDWIHCSREEHAGRAKFVAKSQTYLHRARGPCPCGVEHAPDPSASAAGMPRTAIDAVYRYRDADGKVVHETVRYKDKRFRQRRPLGNGRYAWDLDGVEPVLYNLPALLAAAPEEAVWIVEGEKDANRLGTLGLLATTNPMGAGKWRDDYARWLVGRHCYIIPDNDEKGRDHALAVARSLEGRAASVRIVELAGLPEKGDVSDWLDAGGEPDRLCEIAFETPEWSPPRPAEAAAPAGDGRPAAGGNGDGRVDFAAMTAADLGLIPLADVVPRNVDWLWEYRLARGEMAILAGEGGLGKSMFLLACAAAVSTGGPWPAGCGTAPVGTVIIVSAEDHPETTIRPRLQAMGADLAKVIICKARAVIDRDGLRTVHPMSLQDRTYWRAVFDRYPDAALFIVDPVPSYLGRGVNDRQNNEIRAVLEPFVEEVVRPRGVCFYANTHLSKAIDARSPIQRITGSIAYANIPRNVHIVVRDPDDHGRRFFAQAKCNNGPDDLLSIGYRIEQRTIVIPGSEPILTAVPAFEETMYRIELAEVMNGGNGRTRGPAPVKSHRLARWLWDQLAAGHAVAVRDLVDRAREAGLLRAATDKEPKPSISPLYHARDRLGEEHPAYAVEETTVSRVGKELKAWRLRPAGEEDEADGEVDADGDEVDAAETSPF
jgi:hypothetical protein